MIDLDGMTFGCELELGDVDTKIRIPKSLGSWDYKDGSIMNSNGTANDPKKILNRYGSEIQVSPTNTTSGLVERVMDIYALFPYNDMNFTTNLHVHIRVPGLKKDIKSLRRIAQWLNRYGKRMFDLIDPIPVPEKSDFMNPLHFKGAWKRYLRRKRSHHTLPSKRALYEMMAAKTPKEFYEAHAPKDRNGKPQFHLVQRPGINLMQLWSDTETIEFRCFTMTDNPRKLKSAFGFTRKFLHAVRSWITPEEILEAHPNLKFQEFWPYDYMLDQIFQMTNVRHNKRYVAEANYLRLIEKGAFKLKDIR